LAVVVAALLVATEVKTVRQAAQAAEAVTTIGLAVQKRRVRVMLAAFQLVLLLAVAAVAVQVQLAVLP
tara:strand:- start:207 stop:410 length:204 start_codon:yes stop_codon:yes gene_type:complete